LRSIEEMAKRLVEAHRGIGIKDGPFDGRGVVGNRDWT
jgi:hypothetical protein